MKHLYCVGYVFGEERNVCEKEGNIGENSMYLQDILCMFT